MSTYILSTGMNSKNMLLGASMYLLLSLLGHILTPIKPSVAAYNAEYVGTPDEKII